MYDILPALSEKNPGVGFCIKMQFVKMMPRVELIMHIPDNYLSPETCTVMAAAALPVLAISIYKVKKELPVEKVDPTTVKWTH